MDNTRKLSQFLQKTTQSIHLSPALKTSLTELSDDVTAVCSTIAKEFEEHHGALVRSSTKVSRASDQSEVEVAELTTCLESADKSFERHKDKTRELQIRIHLQIESCREELQGNESDISNKRLQKEQNEKEIKILKLHIILHEHEAEAKEQEANRLKKQAEAKKGHRNAHIITGVVNTGLFAVGSLLTGGGVAVAWAGAAAVNAIVNTTGAIICQDKLKTLEDEAICKRQLAENETSEKIVKEETARRLEEEIKYLEKNIEELKQAIDSLKQVDSLLCTSVDQSEEFIAAIGGLCEALNNAKNQTDSIKLIKAVIAKKPINAEKWDVRKWIDKFKKQWEVLESKLKMTDADTRERVRFK